MENLFRNCSFPGEQSLTTLRLDMNLCFGNFSGRFAALASVCISTSAHPVYAAGESAGPTAPLPGYKLAWADEFEGSALDTNQWQFRTDSKMWSTQKPENVSVRDGILRLGVKQEKAGDKNYTGSGVISRRAFKFGYYEARFKVPPGAGWHTSFWMMKFNGADTGGDAGVQELDVCENDSVNLRSYGVNVHRWNPKPHVSMGHKAIPTPDLSANYHVFGCEFTPEDVKYYFEGKLVQTVPITNYVPSDQHIWLTTIASSLGGTKAVDDSRLPAMAEYDYVRFFEKK